jgi:hypothetical protein
MEYVQWRKRTVAIAEKLNPNSDFTTTLNQMRPLILTESQKENQTLNNNLDKQLRGLCEQALRLTRQLRKKDAMYTVKDFEREADFSDHCMVEIESETKAAAPPLKSKKVSFTVFGALIKDPFLQQEKKREGTVLKKADVVTY